MTDRSGGPVAHRRRPTGAEGGPGSPPHRAREAGSDGRGGAGLRLGATVAALMAGQAILWRAGAALPSVPLDASGLAASTAGADPLAVAVSLLRLIALGVGAALLAVTAFGALARGCGAARLVVRLDRWTPAGLCRLLDGALGAGLAASIGLSTLPAAAGSAVPPALVATPDGSQRPPDGETTTTLRRLPDAPPGPATTLRRLPDGEPAQPAVPAAPPVVAPTPSAPATSTGRREVVVQPGDSFWRLAERHELARLGRRPTEAEVGACWQQLVAANRHRLAVPGDPDLIFPGQVLIVPCP